MLYFIHYVFVLIHCFVFCSPPEELEIDKCFTAGKKLHQLIQFFFKKPRTSRRFIFICRIQYIKLAISFLRALLLLNENEIFFFLSYLQATGTRGEALISRVHTPSPFSLTLSNFIQRSILWGTVGGRQHSTANST